jgi:hypothetical protein
VKLVGSCQPVGKMVETHRVFAGLSPQGFRHSTRHNLWEGGSEHAGHAHKGGFTVRYPAFCTESCGAAIWIGSVNQDKIASPMRDVRRRSLTGVANLANGATLPTRWNGPRITEDLRLDEGKAANFNPGGRAIRRISRLRLRLCGFSWPRKARSHILLAYYPGIGRMLVLMN